MPSALPDIASQVGANESTFRLAARRGTIRCLRPGLRTFELAPGELPYLKQHWYLLSTLTQALRTEPNVRFAVLYGSRARGTEHENSDVDVLVSFRNDTLGSPNALGSRLTEAVGIQVDVARFSRVRVESPFLLIQAIDEGRVLVDREHAWADIQKERETIARAARRRMSRAQEEASESLSQLLNGDL
jgi:predicted nucleotidyltransferase